MIVNRNPGRPVTPPPPTFDIIGLTAEQYTVMVDAMAKASDSWSNKGVVRRGYGPDNIAHEIFTLMLDKKF